LSGSEGYNTAAKFVANKFEEYGLQDLGFSNYYQKFDVEYNKINESSLACMNKDGSSKTYNLGEDFICRGFSGSGNIEAPVVFCGYGISSENEKYNDYDGIDVDGKIVMQFKDDPRWKVDGERIGYNSLRKKASLAKENGAVGIIYVSRPNAKNPQKPIGSVKYGDGEHLENFPQIHIDLNTAADFFEPSPKTLSELQKQIDTSKKPHSMALGTKARIQVEANYIPEQTTMNVVGMLPAQNQTDEYIVLGAHLDHVGGQAGEVYFPGANDNASGVASMLELARVLSTEKPQKRSIIFIAFAAEESGLEGSQYFVEHSPVDINKIHAMLNMDCVGHGDSVVVGGGKSFPGLYEKVKKEDSLMKSMMVDRTWRGGGADATPFFEEGVSTLYFATKNSYDHLHLQSDKPETLNQELHKYVTDLVYQSAEKLANYSDKENNSEK
ncbi:MAG: M20/M25/M40 family metallo-hydrolase, partial [Bacteroidota bacterium]